MSIIGSIATIVMGKVRILRTDMGMGMATDIWILSSGRGRRRRRPMTKKERTMRCCSKATIMRDMSMLGTGRRWRSGGGDRSSGFW